MPPLPRAVLPPCAALQPLPPCAALCSAALPPHSQWVLCLHVQEGFALCVELGEDSKYLSLPLSQGSLHLQCTHTGQPSGKPSSWSIPYCPSSHQRPWSGCCSRGALLGEAAPHLWVLGAELSQAQPPLSFHRTPQKASGETRTRSRGSKWKGFIVGLMDKRPSGGGLAGSCSDPTCCVQWEGRQQAAGEQPPPPKKSLKFTSVPLDSVCFS